MLMLMVFMIWRVDFLKQIFLERRLKRTGMSRSRSYGESRLASKIP